jgi:thioredoxin reductase (NADPH)
MLEPQVPLIRTGRRRPRTPGGPPVTSERKRASHTMTSASTDGGSKIRDVVIIGSGPAGYTAAVYAARANLAPLVFEGSVTAGGALMNTTEVENFPGFRDGIMGPQLMDEMRAQAERFGAKLVSDDVTAVDLTGEVKVVTDGAGTQHRARSVILSTGSGYRRLGIEGEDRLSGHGVSWCATCDGFFFRNQHIAVVGGGDSALEEATFLARFAATVTVVHRRDELRASKIMQDRAFAEPKIEFAWNSAVEAIHGEDRLTGVTLVDTVTGEKRLLDVTGLFIAVGHDPRSELLGGQVDLDENGYVLVEHPSTRTNLPGVFACGDLVDHHYRQAVTAAGTGCAAALDAERFLAALDHEASTAGAAEASVRAVEESEELTEEVQTAGA